jgi:hypothetical protein
VEPVPLCEPWPVSGCTSFPEEYNPAVTGVGLMAASELLWGASGRRYGACEVTFRPCARRCHEQPYGGWWWTAGSFHAGWPYGPVHGGWVAAVCGSCQSGCACTSAAELVLPGAVQSVSEVSVDGVVLPASGYAFYPGPGLPRLVRADGGEWPFCQDWSVVAGPGTFEVTAAFGEPVPALGTLAMGEVLPEVLKACTEGECRLPAGTVRAKTRQGVQKVFVDPEAIRKGRLGLPLTDRFLMFANPEGLTEGAKVWNPDDVLDGGPYRVGGP